MKKLLTLILFLGFGTFSFNTVYAQQKDYNSAKSNTSKIKEEDRCKKSCCKKKKKGTNKDCKETCCAKKAPKGKAKKEKKTKVKK